MVTTPHHDSNARRVILAQLLRAVAVGALPFVTNSTKAQSLSTSYPSKPVRLVVPFAPGGSADQLARTLGRQLELAWKQPVLVDNRGGGAGIIGTEMVARAPGDGHTMGMVVSGHTINPSLQDKMPYDTLRDLSGVIQLTSQQMVWIAHPSAPFNTIAELITYAKKNPNRVAYGTSGIGVATHLFGEMLNQRAGISLTNIPYRGIAPAYVDLLSGQIPLACDITSSALLPYVTSGRLKLIALSGPRRSSKYPDYPVVAETLPGLTAMSMFGLVMPSTTPRPLINEAYKAVRGAMDTPDLRELLDASGMEAVGSTPEQFDRYIASEIRRWAEIIERANIKLVAR